MGKKNIILLVGLIVLGLIIVIFFLSPSQQSSDLSDNINASRDLSSNVSFTGNVSAEIPGDHVLGLYNSKNTIVEYASLTCPHCAIFHGEVFPKIKSELIDKGKVKYIFRDFPIDPLAMAGSMIAHCSGDSKYFGVIDVLLKTQDEWSMQGMSSLKVALIFCVFVTAIGGIISNPLFDFADSAVNGTPLLQEAITLASKSSIG